MQDCAPFPITITQTTLSSFLFSKSIQMDLCRSWSLLVAWWLLYCTNGNKDPIFRGQKCKGSNFCYKIRRWWWQKKEYLLLGDRKMVFWSNTTSHYIIILLCAKDMFDRRHNPSHLTLYPDFLKIKTIIVVKQKFAKIPFVYYLQIYKSISGVLCSLAAEWPDYRLVNN